MKFNSKSVLLNDGVPMNLKVHFPDGMPSSAISSDKWVNALLKFNSEVLNTRASVSEKCKGHDVDVLYLTLVDGHIEINMVGYRHEVPDLLDTKFTVTGQLVYTSNTTLDEIVIKNVLYEENGQNKPLISNNS